MTIHIFGARSSKGCPNLGFQEVANDYKSEFGTEAADFVRNEFYIDDDLSLWRQMPKQ